MKTKLLFLFTMACLLASEIYAGPTIILRGGGKQGKYDYVHSSKNKLVCSGAGNIQCPVAWAGTHTKGVDIRISDITGEVEKLIESGESNGEFQSKTGLPVRWISYEDGFEFEILADVEITYNK